MSKIQMQGLALVFLMASLPLISIGATAGVGFLWGTGLVLLAFGGSVLAIARYTSLVSKNKGRVDRGRGTRRKDE